MQYALFRQDPPAPRLRKGKQTNSGLIKFSFVKGFSVFLFLLAFLFVFANQAQAATYTVTSGAATAGSCTATCTIQAAITAANSNAGADTIEFNIPTSDASYVAASGSTQAYWAITLTTVLTLTDDSGVTINGYSQSGASRNTAAFGETLNTVLTVRLVI